MTFRHVSVLLRETIEGMNIRPDGIYADGTLEAAATLRMKKGGGLIADIIGDNLETSETESEFELNLALVKLRHKIKRKSSNK